MTPIERRLRRQLLTAWLDWYGDSCPCRLPLGECKVHPRVREEQRPPAGDWNSWLFMGGRGTGKTQAGSVWVNHVAETNPGCRIAIVGATAADARDVMVQGPAGILATARSWERPQYQPSLRSLQWPNGSIGTTFSAEEPERLRGPQHHFCWADELGAWKATRSWHNLRMGLRLGAHPRMVITTTPRRTALIQLLVADPMTAITRGSSYRNRAHLSPDFFDKITALYQGTKLGRQELDGELIEGSMGQVFESFSRDRHVSADVQYWDGYPYIVAIDIGASRDCGVVFLQLQESPAGRTIAVFDELHFRDRFSQAIADEVRQKVQAEYPALNPHQPTYKVLLDPMGSPRTSLGPTPHAVFSAAFGARHVGPWPLHGIAEGVDRVNTLLEDGPTRPIIRIHPRCEKLIQAFLSLEWDQRRGEYTDQLRDAQHPHEDMLDAFRGAVKHLFPSSMTPKQKGDGVSMTQVRRKLGWGS